MLTASLLNITKTEIKALAKGGYFNSKDSFIEEAVKYMLSSRGDLKINAAVEMYSSKDVSMSRTGRSIYF